MFNLGKLSSTVLKDLGGLPSQASDIIAKALNGQQMKVSGALAALAKALGSSNAQTAKLAELMARAKYVEILQEALEKAMKPGGNTRTQILDLRTRLDNLSREEGEAKTVSPEQMDRLIQTQREATQLFEQLSNILSRMNQSSMDAIRNIR